MLIHRSLIALGLTWALLVSGSESVEGAKKARKASEHKHHGVVEKVQHDKNKKGGSITIKEHHHQKNQVAVAGKNAAGAKGKAGKGMAGKEATFQVSAATRVEKVSGKKKNRQHHPASLSDIHKGSHVVVMSKGHMAEKVTIVHHHHKKKKKANA